jgi:hypothetical protein
MLALNLDLPAWDAGFEAGFRGRPLTACLYPAGSKQAWSWHAGFIEGKAARTETHPQDFAKIRSGE